MHTSCYWKIVCFALALASYGCATNPAPRGWLGPAQSTQADPYGAWILVSSAGEHDVSGEFLAVDEDSIFVLQMDGAVRGIRIANIRKATIAFYDAQWGVMLVWTALGSMSTISHGFGLIFTFPVWVIGGSLATASEHQAPLIRVKQKEQLNAVRMYARFPGGVPADLPRTLPPRLPATHAH